jgi:hypothetical protein
MAHPTGFFDGRDRSGISEGEKIAYLRFESEKNGRMMNGGKK